jgi:hypothetical protein
MRGDPLQIDDTRPQDEWSMIPRTIGEGTSVDETNIGHRTNGQCPTIDVVYERMYEGM